MAEDLQDLVNVYTGVQILVCSQLGDAEPLKKIPVELKNEKQTNKKPLP